MAASSSAMESPGISAGGNTQSPGISAGCNTVHDTGDANNQDFYIVCRGSPEGTLEVASVLL